jgi:peptide/nickel transport system permease protein
MTERLAGGGEGGELVPAAGELSAAGVGVGSGAAAGTFPSGDATRPPRLRGGRGLAAVFPGLPQLLAGRVAAGGYTLLLWLALLGLVAWRWERIVAAPTGPLDHQLALLTLVLALASAWTWAFRDAAKGAAPLPHSRSQWGLATRAFRKNRTAVAALMAIVSLYLMALLTPFLAPFDPTLQGDLVTMRLQAPSGSHPLGTDHFARDVLSRILYGSRVSLSIGLIAVSISITIGTLLGALAGFIGGALDSVIMRFVDMVISFPRLILLITIIALFEPTIFLIVAVLGLTQWPQVTRIVRGEVLSLREREFIQAGRALGFSRARIILRHVIPNVLAPVIVAATLGIGDTIVLEAGLSFLGMGVQPPTPSWGTIVADGRNNLLGAWWISTFSGLAIVFTVVSFNLAGDGLRDALDPRQRS